MAAHPVIDYSKCNGCLECVKICPMDVFVDPNGKENADPVDKPNIDNSDACIACRACELQCDKKAIKIVVIE